MKSFLTVIAITSLSFMLKAQEVKEARLTEVLNQYESQLGIKFSFDPEIIKYVEEKFTYEPDLANFISKVEEHLPFQFQKVGDQYYTLSSIATTYSITVSDSLSNELIVPQDITLLINSEPIEIEVLENVLSFDYKPKAQDKVEIYSIGYSKRRIDLSDFINKKHITINISSPLMKLSEIVIKDYLTKGINLNPSNQSVNISVRDLPLLPGETDGDIFASITALPGVTNPDGRAGNLYVRGSDTDQTMILFDNIPVYHKGHYYGTISSYNPKIVDNVEVYRNGFHPRLGGKVGGAIVINSDHNIAKESTTGFGLNTLFGMAYTKLPLANNKLGISIGARRSYPREVKSPKLKAISESVFDGTGLVNDRGHLTGDVEVLFEDYMTKIHYQVNDKNKLSLSAIYTNTDIASKVDLGPNSQSTTDQNQFHNLGFNMDWASVLDNNWKSKLSITHSNYKYEYVTLNDASMPILSANNELKDFNIRQEFSKINSNFASYQMGVDYKWQEVLVDYKSITQEESIIINNTTGSHSFSPFANFELRDLEKWYFQFGIRGTYYSKLNHFKLAPRFLVNYELADWMTLKGSTGWYNQYLSQVKNLEFGGGGFENELWTLADNDQGHILDGRQSMLGFIIQKGSWIFDVEAFSKTANNVTVYEDRRFSANSGYFTMDQFNYGVDFLLKKQLNDDASVWIGYSKSKSEIKLDTTERATYESKYVQPDVLYLGGAVQRKNWKFSAAWKYSSGLNARSLDIIYAEILRLRMLNNNNMMTPPNPFANRAPRYASYHALDFSVSFKLPKNDNRKWSATFGLSVINAFDQDILVDQVFRGESGFVDRQGLGFAPNIMAIIEW